MLTIDDVAAIPLLSGLPAADLEQVARHAADIHLAAGEYAAHEGEERVLFAVLSGRIEVTKLIDGVERNIGWRARSEASNTQGLDVYLIGAGNSAGQAALYFSSYARTVTLLVRGGWRARSEASNTQGLDVYLIGDALEKSMSHYLIEQVRAKPNVRIDLQAEVQAVHGDDRLTAIDIVQRAAVRRHRAPAH
jgi:thioredoxin reductase